LGDGGHTMGRNLTPATYARVVAVESPSEARWASGAGYDFADVHAAVLVYPSLTVKQLVGSSPTRIEGCRHTQGMPKPRTPRLDKVRTPLAHRLVQLRIDRELTQIEVADAVGISRAHLGKIEAGRDMPGREVLEALANFFGVSMDWVQSGLHPTPPTPQGGRLVKDLEQLKVLDLWESIPADERPRVARMLLAAAMDPAKSS
jgi:transcriptional regulator with XRE-family HTH domain